MTAAADGFEASAVRRRVWLRLWDVALVMNQRDYDRDSVDADHAFDRCLDAQSELVEAAICLAEGDVRSARLNYDSAEAQLRAAVPAIPLVHPEQGMLSSLNPPEARAVARRP
jgi:hypothetical protein